jgi:tartrate/fumarate subfamily iron-sulfur-dependent hydro-lyase beta chain
MKSFGTKEPCCEKNPDDPDPRRRPGEKEVIRQTGVKLVVGKGGMGPETAAGCLENKALHAIFPGGCAVLAATKVEKIEGAEWKDQGMPETLWANKVNEFGPLIISIDTKGNNLIEQTVWQHASPMLSCNVRCAQARNDL